MIYIFSGIQPPLRMFYKAIKENIRCDSLYLIKHRALRSNLIKYRACNYTNHIAVNYHVRTSPPW